MNLLLSRSIALSNCTLDKLLPGNTWNKRGKREFDVGKRRTRAVIIKTGKNHVKYAIYLLRRKRKPFVILLIFLLMWICFGSSFSLPLSFRTLKGLYRGLSSSSHRKSTFSLQFLQYILYCLFHLNYFWKLLSCRSRSDFLCQQFH